MARPVEFEYDVVLSRAMEQFWREGFEASSVQKLLDATEINRGTLYNSFGDKETFFKKCLDRYNDELQNAIDETLGNADIKPKEAIIAWFDKLVISAPPKQRQLGCLLVNSVCESINWNKDIQKYLRASLSKLRKALLARTKELDKAKKLHKGVKPELAADALLSAYSGLQVDARNGKAPKQMREILDVHISAVCK